MPVDSSTRGVSNDTIIDVGNSSQAPQNDVPESFRDEMLIDDVVKLCFYSFLILFALLGNSFVLFVLYRKRKQFNFWRVNLFIFHLAVGDMLVALTAMPVNLMYASSNGHWLFGDTSCKVTSTFFGYGSIDFSN